jgi:hypothetical protein
MTALLREARRPRDPLAGGDFEVSFVRLLATTEPTRQDFPGQPAPWRNSLTEGQCKQPRPTQPQRTMVCPHAPRWRRHPASPPYPASPDPRMVAQDGRHRGHHLGEPNHELDPGRPRVSGIGQEGGRARQAGRRRRTSPDAGRRATRGAGPAPGARHAGGGRRDPVAGTASECSQP